MGNEMISTFYSIDKDIREIILDNFGFRLKDKINSYILYLTPYVLSKTIIKNITKFLSNKYQKINRFFNYKEYVSKSLLYNNYKIFKKKFPEEFNYMFETYSYHEEKFKIYNRFKNYKFINSKDMWLIKPKAAAVGHGILFLKDFSDIKFKKNYIITKYLKNPYLIKGYKNDFRFHGLISSIKPLKLYLYNEGLIRFASEKYNLSSTNPNKFFFN